jgi:glucokinase
MARERLGAVAPSTAHEVALLARSGNDQAREIFETVGHALAIALTALINTLNLPLYLLGGGVCEAWDLFSPVMFSELHRRSYIYRLTEPQTLAPEDLERHKTYVLGAQLGSAAGLLGACVLGFQEAARNAAPDEVLFVRQ